MPAGPRFVDLQQSPAGFGETHAEAVEALHAELQKLGRTTVRKLSVFKVHDDR
jgi:hypothetical protein